MRRLRPAGFVDLGRVPARDRATLPSMAHRVGNEHWSLACPKGWRSKDEPDCLSLVPPSEVGALQLSSHVKKGGPVDDADLLEFAADHIGAGAPRRDVRLGDFTGFEITYDTDAFACREWYLRKSKTLLYATYSCHLAQRGSEDEVVERALVSLRAGPVGDGAEG